MNKDDTQQDHAHRWCQRMVITALTIYTHSRFLTTEMVHTLRLCIMPKPTAGPPPTASPPVVG